MHPYLAKYYLDQTTSPKRQTAQRGSFRAWFSAFIRHWQRRKMTAILMAMDDRTLRDIGVSRGDIRRLVGRFDDRELRMVPLAVHEALAGKDRKSSKLAA